MANEKRTMKQIEKDFKVIREVAQTATSMKELESVTGLSLAMINTTLSKHPVVSKRIKEQLNLNKQKAKAEAEARKQEELKAKEEAKKVAKLKQEKETQENVDINQNKISGFVIDASIAGTDKLRKNIERICASKEKIILTSVTVKELHRMERFDDIPAKDASYLLSKAVHEPENFEVLSIDETFNTPDDCIVEFCTNNDVTLLTADKEMTLNARMHNVNVEYFEKSEYTSKKFNNKINTLFVAKRFQGKLVIADFELPNKSICVYSDGIEYSKGTYELKIGDDVYISSKKEDYVTFAHYKIISLYEKDNCELVYARRIYDYNNIKLEKSLYTSFVKRFIATF